MERLLLFSGGGIVVLLSSLMLTPWIRAIARRHDLTDAPDRERKIHTEDIPRIGGVAVVGAFLIGLAYFGIIDQIYPGAFVLPASHFVAGAILIGMIGLLDDLFGLHFSHKFTAQIILSVLVISGGFRFEILPASMTESALDPGWWLTAILTVVWIVGITNAVNLLDGMDGLAAGVAVIALAGLTGAGVLQGTLGSAVLPLILIAALLGFLVYNFNPASIFMGDTGSFFVGFLLAVISLPSPGSPMPVLTALIPVVVLGLPVADTGLTVIRRYLTGRPLFFPDQDHIHHRMVSRRRLSHRRTVLILYIVAAFLGFVGCAIAAAKTGTAVTVLISLLVLGSYGFVYWLGYLHYRDIVRLLAERVARRAPRVDVPVSTNGHAANGAAKVNGKHHAKQNGVHVTREAAEAGSSSQAHRS